MHHALIAVLVLTYGGEECRQTELKEKMSKAFVSAPESPFHVGPMAGLPAIGDMNGDNRLDVVVACGTCCGSKPQPTSGHVFVLLNDGSAKLVAAKGSPFKVGPSVRRLALGDVNGDGQLDVVAAEHDTYNVTVLLGIGDGGLQTAPGSPFIAASGSQPHTHAIALADVNRDNKPDVLTTNANDNTISVLLNDGRGRFASAEGSPFATGRHPYDAIIVQDVSGDSYPDIVVPFLAGNKIGVMFGNGQGQFESPAEMRFPVGERPGYVAVADVNGDGRLDILATHDDVGMIDVLLGNDKNEFKPAPGSPIKLDTPVWGIATGDLNKDGRMDIALGPGRDSGIIVLIGDAKAGFIPTTLAAPHGGSQPNYLALADLNADSKLDIITGNYGSGDVSVLLAR